MAKTTKRRAFGLTLIIAILASAGGCATASAKLEQQAAALQAAELSPSIRYAVAVRDTGLHTKPRYPIGDEIASRIAALVSRELGIDAVALSSTDGTPWSDELARANDATGIISTSNNRDFFRSSGFDGYVLISLYEEIEYYDRPDNDNRRRKFFTYDPFFNMVSLRDAERQDILMQSGFTGRFSCEIQGDKLKNATDCVDTFVKRFRRALNARLERIAANQRTSQ